MMDAAAAVAVMPAKTRILLSKIFPLSHLFWKGRCYV